MIGRMSEDVLTRMDRRASVWVGLAVAVLYVLTFSSVPTSDGQSFIGMIDDALAHGRIEFPETSNISNAPFSYYAVFWLQWAATRVGLHRSTLQVFHVLNAAVSGLAASWFYRTIRVAGCDPVWAFVGTWLAATSYGVWYFANGEAHHIGLAILIFLFYRLALLRRDPAGPRYATLIGLGLLNALAVFFHQEHFIFGLAAVALLAWERPWRRSVPESVAYGVSGSLGTFAIIYLLGRLVMGKQSLEAIAHWYFWPLFGLAHDYRAYVPEPLWVIAARLVKGQLTAFDFGVQVLVDLLGRGEPGAGARMALYALLATIALGLMAACLVGLWFGRRRLTGEPGAIAVGALVWLVSYPVLLAWYFPAVTEYYLKTVPPLVLLVVLGGWAWEHVGAVRIRAAALALLIVVAGTNALTAMVPWYRYGLMRDRLAAAAGVLVGPGDLVISLESGIDPVFAGHGDALAVKDLLYREGKARGFDRIREAIADRLDGGHRVLLYNLIPSRWALVGLDDPGRVGAVHDHYQRSDFEALQGELEARYRLVPVLEYWEESKEPLYLFGRHLTPIFEVRRR